MGFGTLFIGYFFLLNFPYCEYTDAVSAVLMLYALYKLRGINDYFKYAFAASVAFALLGIFELSAELYGMFSHIDRLSLLFTIITLSRQVIIGAATALMLLGIKDVADEVGLSALKEKSLRAFFVSMFVYLLNIFLESASLASFIPIKILATLYVFATLATLTVIAFNLTCIYSAYMRICMPEDKEMEDKESKIGFVRSFKKREEEKSREYAEYKLNKMQKKQEKKNKGK